MEHVFGKPGGSLKEGERFCNEPLAASAEYDRVFHTTFEMLPGGNFQCTHCQTKFLPEEPS